MRFEQSDVSKKDVYAVLVKIEQIPLQSSTHAAPDHSFLTPRSELSSGVTSKVRIPKLTIQPFNGEPTKWLTFWDSYRTAIDDNPSLTEVEKFSYLHSSLLGPALEAISGLALSTANYKLAVDILHKWFGNRQVII